MAVNSDVLPHRREVFNMIRTILGVIFTALFLILTLPVFAVQALLRKIWPHLGERSSFAIVQTAFRILQLPLGVHCDFIGLENIPRDEPVLFIGNHRSYLDVILVYPKLPPITGFVAKHDFEKVPILPLWMRRLYCEFLVKDDLKQNLQSILNAIDHVKTDKVSMFIYPEGGRSTCEDERDLLPFHEGSFKIATKSNCPIVPVAVCGTRERWETQFPKMRPGHVIIEFGKPIRTAEMSREELKGIGAKTRDIVREMVVRNHDLL